MIRSIIVKPKNEGFDLDATFSCGQTFRWQKVGRAWFGVVGDKPVSLTRIDRGILAETPVEPGNWSWLKKYLLLQTDYDRIIEAINKDDFIGRAIATFPGLRILRQDPWECLAAFVLSSANSITQIQRSIERLASLLGRALPRLVEEIPAHSFPTPESLAKANSTLLRSCKIGFRTPYLQGIARAVCEGIVDLNSISNMSTEEARGTLMSLSGVGRKIADCVLLFAYERYEVFPIDTWIRQAMIHYYFRGKPVPDSEIYEFATSHFGKYAGYAQQFIYHYTRTQLAPQLDLALAKRKRRHLPK